MKNLLFLAITFFIIFKANSQDLHLRGIAINYSQTGRITPKLNYNVHILSVVNASTLTIGDKTFQSGHTHFIPHLLLNYKITDKWNVGGGYAFGRHDIFGLRENENRFIAQTAYNQKVKKITFNNRGRIEFRSPLNLQTKIRSNATVFRYQLGLNYPLYDTKKYKKGFYALVSNEVFLYLKGAKNGPVSSKNGLLLSENWSNIGLGYTTGKNRIEMGYGFQSLVRNKKQEMRFLNLLQLSFTTTINWDDVQYWYY
jgi:Protein of unknown function (DUF2490)